LRAPSNGEFAQGPGGLAASRRRADASILHLCSAAPANPDQILSVLKTGIERARTVGQEPLKQVRRAMNMDLG